MCGCMWCMYVWRGEGAALWHNSISEKLFLKKNWYTSVAHVSFDEIHRTVIT